MICKIMCCSCNSYLLYPISLLFSIFTEEFVVIFENSSYGVLEDIGLDDFAVRVCFNVFNLTDTTTIQLTTQDGSATSNAF